VCDVEEGYKIGVLVPEDLPSEQVYTDWTENSTVNLPGSEVRVLITHTHTHTRTIRVMILS